MNDRNSSISLVPLNPPGGGTHVSTTSREDEAESSPISPLIHRRNREQIMEEDRPPSPETSSQKTPLGAEKHQIHESPTEYPTWIPEKWHRKVDPIFRRLPTGWKLGTAGAAVLTFLILLANITITAVSYAKVRQKGYKTSVAPLRTGDCGDIKELGVVIHLMINIISTLLLGASSYCMQSVSAPTRADVDQAHAKGSYVDIGIPSLRNLRWIKRRRLLIWVCLCISSVPLHLVYNSTFFVSTNDNLYQIYYADESFARGAPYNESFFEDKDSLGYDADPKTMQRDLMAGQRFQNLSNNECINAYAKTLVDDRSTLILVVDRPENCSIFKDPNVVTSHYEDCGNTSATSLYDMTTYGIGIKPAMDPYVSNWFYWVCDQKDVYLKGGPISGANQYEAPPKDLCSDGLWKTRLDADPWVASGANVRYCLSETVSSQCHLNVAVNLLWVVIAFNIIKLIIMCVLVTSNLINKYPLVTIGDAAASFIESPDPKTKAMCLYTAKEITSSKSIQTAGATLAREYLSTKHRWSAAVSKRRWILASTLTFLALAIVLSLLGYAATILRRNYSRGSLASLWGFGLGAITPYTLITSWAIPTHGDAAVVGAVLVANLPQLLLSFLYLVLNSLITSMALSAEWAGYAAPASADNSGHRALRVSFPRGGQRSSYFLQLPYRLGVPLLVASVLVHWLVSQSIFVAQVNQVWPGELSGVDPSQLDPEDSLTTCAYSPRAMILTCFAVVGVWGFAVALGRRRLRGGVPLAGSCSLAIAAACHAPEGTSSLVPVAWGVVRTSEGEGEEEGVGHCAFSNDEVEVPMPGRLYA